MSATVIVTGMIATYPVGGVAWDYGQYLVGMERLGFDVVYLEDTGWLNYDPDAREYRPSAAAGVRYLAAWIDAVAPQLRDRWHVRGMDGETFGLEPDDVRAALDDAELFLNVSGGTILRPEYLPCRNKVLIDTDPGWNHFRNWPEWRPKPDWPISSPFTAHDHFFTYAEAIGEPACRLPDFGLEWHKTRPPVLLDQWSAEPPGDTWTTVMTWKNFRDVIEHEGVRYGAKEDEFATVEDVPARVAAHLELAIGGSEYPAERWRGRGWSLVDARDVSTTPDAYRHYIQRSRGEFSVAKNVYVAVRSAWFSCRSACYLAAGRPVVVQDTGFSRYVPTGEGLLAFSNGSEAVAALTEVERNYGCHAEAAQRLAASHFGAGIVLAELVDRCGVSP